MYIIPRLANKVALRHCWTMREAVCCALSAIEMCLFIIMHTSMYTNPCIFTYVYTYVYAYMYIQYRSQDGFCTAKSGVRICKFKYASSNLPILSIRICPIQVETHDLHTLTNKNSFTNKMLEPGGFKSGNVQNRNIQKWEHVLCRIVEIKRSFYFHNSTQKLKHKWISEDFRNLQIDYTYICTYI